jgi:hypothetical protein
MSMIFILIKIKFIKFIIKLCAAFALLFHNIIDNGIMKKNEFDFVKIKAPFE